MQANNAMKREAAGSRQSMRAFLSALEDAGELVTISQPVDLDYEIAGCLAEADDGPALLFRMSKIGRCSQRCRSSATCSIHCHVLPWDWAARPRRCRRR